MKKILLTLLTGLFISLSAFAQNYTVTIYGTVMVVINNSITPVPDQAVIISIDSSNYGFTYQNTVYTDETGYYEDVVEIPGYTGYEYVQTMTYDSCLGQYQYNGQFLVPGTTLTSMDFYLCNVPPNPCLAMFYYIRTDPADPYTFQFVNISSGGYTQVYWSFGDSTFSSEESPIHTFPGPGNYYVCLTISDGADCSSIYCDFIYTGGGGNGCENYFTYYNSNNDPYTFTFEGFLSNGQYAQSYWWDFGDGTSEEGQTVTHTYMPVPGTIGMYMVGLSTMVMDSINDSCFYTSYQEVWIQNPQGCNAYFSYYPDSLNLLTLNFLDMSFDPNGLPPYSWFWEFGDSTSSTLQNPVHTYADTGYYMVCLTIADSTGLCTSTYCEEVFTGFPPPPSECESYIMPMNMYGLTVDFEGYTISQYETEYTWEFGDGVTAMGQSVSHTYPYPGSFITTLQTVDATGCSYLTSLEIWVDTLNQQGCGNYFTYEQVDSTTFTFSGVVYLNNGMTYPDSTTIFSWDFGDGTTGTGQTVTHYFQANPAGGYTVCLTTTTILPDGSACSAYYCDAVNMGVPSFNIFGYVYLDNNLVADQAVVHLMAMDSTWQNVIEVQSTTVDSGGFYSFPDIPMYNSRLYYIQAELTEGSAYFGQYVPTYFESALTWEEATPWLPLMNWPANIYMIAGSTMSTGDGTISGIVSDLGTRGFMNDVEIVLMDADKNPYTYLRSDEQGAFNFDGLAYGTYIIHAELMGIHTVQAQVTLSTDQPEANVQVQVSGGEANIVFGMPEQEVAIDNVGNIYPNPVYDIANLDITVKKPVNINISTFGQTGQLMNVQKISLIAGTHNLKLDMGSLPPGLYLVRITSGQGEIISRKFMKVQ
jgi:PKD repeat protein